MAMMQRCNKENYDKIPFSNAKHCSTIPIVRHLYFLANGEDHVIISFCDT